MNFANLTVKKKLIGGFGIMAALVVVLSAMSLKSLAWATDGFSHYVNGINARAVVASELREAVDRRAIAARNLVLVVKPADVALEKSAALQAQQDVTARLKQLNEMLSGATDRSDKAMALASEMNRVEALYSPIALKIVSLALEGKRDEAVVMLDDQCRPLLSALINATDAYASYTRDRQAERVAEYDTQYARQQAWMIGFSLGAIALATLACWLITRAITRPIGSAVTVAQTVARGNLTSDVTSEQTNETGALLRALHDMNLHLRVTVERVRNSANSITTATQEIAAGNLDLSQRTEEQAASLEETAASMDELTHTVQQNAQNAQQATVLAGTATTSVVKGAEVIDRMVQTMQAIQQSSAKIAEITGMIEGIAFQTNILALNAAVEAARAGDEGRGFAVVASEVRNLAQRSASAAKEIGGLIATSVVQVQEGALLVSEAGATMHEVRDAVGRVSAIMGDIAVASDEQGHGIEQINRAVAAMDEVTQQNAALVEEAAAASESLRQQGRELTDAMAFFVLADDVLTAQAREFANDGTDGQSGRKQPDRSRSIAPRGGARRFAATGRPGAADFGGAGLQPIARARA